MDTTVTRTRMLGVGVLVLSVLIGGAWFIIQKGTSSSDYYASGQAAFRSGNYEQAVNDLQKASTLDIRNRDIQALLGRSLVAYLNNSTPTKSFPAEKRLQLYQEAVAHLEQALSLGLSEENYVEYARFLRAHGLAYWGLKKYDKADEIFLRAIAKYQDAVFIERVLVASDYTDRLNKPQEALNILSIALKSPAEPGINHELLTKAHATMMRLSSYFKKFPDTEKYAKLVMDTTSQDDTESLKLAYTHMAYAAGSRNDFPAVMDWLKKADDLWRDPNHHACALAYIYYSAKKYDSAIASAKQRDGVSCWATLAQSFAATGKNTESRQYAQKVLDTVPTTGDKDIFISQAIQQMKDILKTTNAL